MEEVLRRAGEDLADARARFAVIGGLAVSVRSGPRFTRDVDLAVAVAGDPQAEALAQGMVARGYRAVATVDQKDRGRFAQVRLVPPGGSEEGVVVDLLFASSGIESDVVAAAETLEVVPGLRLPVATTGHLLALKVLSRDDLARPQDLADIRSLLRVATEADREAARRALRLIGERGYARGRSLPEDFEKLASPRA